MSLDCEHGRRGNSPLHVRCLLDMAANAANAGNRGAVPHVLDHRLAKMSYHPLLSVLNMTEWCVFQ